MLTGKTPAPRELKLVGPVAALLLSTVGLLAISCGRSGGLIEGGAANAGEKSSRAVTSRAAFTKAIAEIRRNHPGAKFWRSPGQKGPPWDPNFTLKAQDRIDQLHETPVIVVAEVVDVYRVGANHRLLCGTNFHTYFLLDCTPQQARNIVDTAVAGDDFWNRSFAIVCNLADAKVLADIAHLESMRFRGSEGETAPFTRVYLTGTCIEVRHIPGFDLSVDWDDLEGAMP